jgi:hypothetical protein
VRGSAICRGWLVVIRARLRSAIKDRRMIVVKRHRDGKNRNHSVLPRKAQARARTPAEFKDHLESLGVDASAGARRGRPPI